jgi:hypothetical protein
MDANSRDREKRVIELDQQRSIEKFLQEWKMHNARAETAQLTPI